VSLSFGDEDMGETEGLELSGEDVETVGDLADLGDSVGGTDLAGDLELAVGNGDSNGSRLASELERKYGLPIGRPVVSPPRLDEILGELPGLDVLRLFNYLKSITMDLPDERLADYLISDERVQLEYIIDRLSGRPGLKDQASALRAREGIVSSTAAAERIEESFAYLESLVEELPDQGFAVIMKNRLERLRERIEAAGDSA
jgi:hypothetical protein